MLDIVTLQDRGRYKQDEYLQQAAHERLLGQLRAPVARPARLGRLGPLLVIATVLLLALRPEAAPVAAAPSASLSAGLSAPTLASAIQSDCWVSGDLVGDANPATIAATLCGR